MHALRTHISSCLHSRMPRDVIEKTIFFSAASIVFIIFFNFFYCRSKNCPECRHAVGGSGDLRQLYFNVDHNTPSDLSPPPTEGDDMTSILRQWIHDLKCEREKERIKFKETTTKYLKKVSFVDSVR